MICHSFSHTGNAKDESFYPVIPDIHFSHTQMFFDFCFLTFIFITQLWFGAYFSTAQGRGRKKNHLFQPMYFWIGGSQVNNKAKILLRAPAAQWGYVLVLINAHIQPRPLKQCRGSGRQNGVSGMKRFDKFSQPQCTQSISPHIQWRSNWVKSAV